MNNRHIKNRYLAVADFLLCFLAYALVIRFIFPASDFMPYYRGGLFTILSACGSYLLCLFIFELYQVNWMFAGISEYLRLLVASVLAGGVTVLAGLFLSPLLYPKLDIAAAALITILIFAFRFYVYFFQKLRSGLHRKKGKRTLIIGAGSLAVSLLREIQEGKKLNYEVVGLIDDAPQKRHQRIFGTMVLGTREDIPRICKEKDIEEIIFAIYNISHDEKLQLLDICSETGKKVKLLPTMHTVLHENGYLPQFRDIDIEDLLDREPIILDTRLIAEDIHDKVVLVTGGGGSIGSELCRQIAGFMPRLLVVVDMYENTTFELQNELREKFPDLALEVLIASVRDKERLASIFAEFRPEIVFHAAAHKHVPLMEFSPAEAIKNNVFGTLNAVNCAEEYGVRRFVLISTDKAVNPTNIMGASKRLCEMIVQSKRGSTTEFVAVRFGNVLGSNGSVVPRFKKQIAAGGPITVTHPEITRFFMTIPEAAGLVLQAAASARGGEIFVLDMGKPVRIYDLARKLIRLSGYEPDKDIEIVFTGLRPGEKLYEELLMSEEGLAKTGHDKIFVGKPIEISHADLEEKLDILADVLQKDTAAVVEAFKTVVPTYRPQR